ncbi:TPA: (2Fe-2S)-binding protein [Pseudomonas aeruginosa]|jgi:isoquinoline 1-oxidoreductase alpha subunit|nr:(2Fe-2S)-binding protein [Pseudomonas aeruginosa]
MANFHNLTLPHYQTYKTPAEVAVIEFYLNGKKVQSQFSDDTPLLWVIRDEFKLKGTKFGCGIAMCGACTLHVGESAVRSCVYPLAMVRNQYVTTIEGLGDHPLQRAWVAQQTPQCGYCQSGQIMQAATLLKQIPHPTEDDILNHMSSNLCRCMTYRRIKEAIKHAGSIPTRSQASVDMRVENK